MTEQATVLVVDDDESILTSVADVLRLGGYQLLMAQSGLKALQVLRYHTPDLIVSDITMPDMDGYEFYQAVRSNPDWTTIPFIFLSARGQPKDIRHGYQLGADHYLTKPIDPEDLLVAVEMRLKRTADIQAAARGEVERTKQQLLTVMGHELRTPLNWVYGYVSLLQEGHQVMTDEVVDRMLHSTRQGTERLMRLVEDLMLLVHLDSGLLALEVERHRQPTVLGPAIEVVVQTLKPRAQEKDIAFTYPPTSDLTVLAVPAYIEDVLRCLIDNAVKFGKEGGHVWIKVEEQDGWAVISVQDNGIGIEPEQQARLFERFEQIDRDRMEQQGAGLGLAIAKGLVELHGGDIQGEGRPGQGSLFTVRLPLANVAPSGTLEQVERD